MSDRASLSCPECQYDLSGHVNAQTRRITCPECGADLPMSRVETYNRYDRRRLIPSWMRRHFGTKGYFVVVALIVLAIPLFGALVAQMFRIAIVFGVSIYVAIFVAIGLTVAGLLLEE